MGRRQDFNCPDLFGWTGKEGKDGLKLPETSSGGEKHHPYRFHGSMESSRERRNKKMWETLYNGIGLERIKHGR